MDSLFALLILASLVLLVVGFFNPNKSLFWYKQERTTKKSSMIYGISLVAFFILFGITTDKKNKNTSNQTSTTSTTKDNSATSEKEEKTAEKKWTSIYTFNGNGMKKSPAFVLTGGEAKIKYKYKAPGGLGMGMFSVYVVNEGEDIMKTGGIPEVMSQAENEESESTIQKSAGKYYLNVNASGSWSVTVEELK